MPPTDGLEAAGWRMVYNSTPNNEPFYTDILPLAYFGDYASEFQSRRMARFSTCSGRAGLSAGLGPDMTVVSPWMVVFTRARF